MLQNILNIYIRCGVCFKDYSYHGLFDYGWTICTLDDSYVGLLIVRWTFRTTDYSYYGLFVPSVKYSHNINSWCEKALTLQAVYQMQVDLGTRLVICVCSCGMLVIFLLIIDLLLVYYFKLYHPALHVQLKDSA